MQKKKAKPVIPGSSDCSKAKGFTGSARHQILSDSAGGTNPLHLCPVWRRLPTHNRFRWWHETCTSVWWHCSGLLLSLGIYGTTISFPMRQTVKSGPEEFVARPGDTVEITEDAKLKVNNGTVSEGEIYYSTPAYDSDVTYPLLLGDNEYFILSDFREGAADSRQFGPCWAGKHYWKSFHDSPPRLSLKFSRPFKDLTLNNKS